MTILDQDDQGSSPRKYFGKYPGVVVASAGNDDATNASVARGEVKVQVPGISEETPDGKNMRPYEAFAAPCFPPGFFFVPEPGAHVWVEFAAGDINHPIWTGVWYPKESVPKTHDKKDPTSVQRVIQMHDAGGNGTFAVILGSGDGALQLVFDEKAKRISLKGENVEIECSSFSVTATPTTEITANKDGLRLVGNKVKVNGSPDMPNLEVSQ